MQKMFVRVLAAILVLVLVLGFVAMAANAEESEIQVLTHDVDGLKINEDTILDLNGHHVTKAVVAEGVTLQLIDSANDEYDASKCGSFAGTVNGTVQQLVQYDAKNYLVIQEEGVYSAHRFYAGITKISLAPNVAGLGYKAYFYADKVINPMVESYGYTMWVNGHQAKTYVKTGAIEKNELTLRVNRILSEDNAELSQLGAAASISGQATITFNINGKPLTVNGAEHTTTLKQAVESVNSSLGADRTSYNQNQIDLVKGMYDKFASYMEGWAVEHILAVEKFVPQEASTVYDTSLTLGQLFAAVEGVTIGENVTVTISGMETVYTPDADWTQSTVKFLGVGEAVITITDNDYCIAATNTVTVAKANPEYTIPENLTATYGDDLSTVALPDGFTWVSTGTVGNAGENTFVALYNNGDANYNTVEVEVVVSVAKAEPSYTVPTGLTATYGDDLSSVALPEGFTWVSTGSVGNAGENTFVALYNNGDANYNTVEVEVVVNVEPADPTVPKVGTLNATYGDDLSTVALPQGFSWVSTGKVGNAGQNTFVAKYNNGDANYNTVEVEVVVNVAPADPTVPKVGTLNATYGDDLSTVALPQGFSWVSTGKVGNAGENTFVALYNNGDANYNTVEVEVVVNVAPVDPTVPEVGTLTATEGEALSTITLPAGFAWVDGNETVTLEKSEYAATYSNGNANYNTVNVNIPVLVSPAEAAVEIERKMPEAEFIYRLGNMNAVNITSLIKNSDDSAIDLTKLSISVAAQNGHVVSGAYDAAKGELTFTGTGLVEITFTGDANSVSLTFEIVNAHNATGAASATANNVVLLNNVGFSTLTVSNGYTLFGNGFTMTAGSEPYADSLGDAFVTLTNGTLDNVRIVVPNFAYSFLYKSQAEERDVKDIVKGPYDKTYYNMRSAVYVTGNSKILNSYISGGRAAVYAVSGHPVLENTTIYGGAVANIHVGAVQSISLKDMTLIQKPIEGTVNGNADTARTVMGFGVIFEVGTEGTSPVLNLDGYLDQFAWVNDSYSGYVPTGADTVISEVLKQGKFLHNIQVDGVANAKWLNLGFAYWPMETGATVSNPTINDNRTSENKAAAPYAKQSIPLMGTTAYVYSIENTNAHNVNTPDVPAILNNAPTAPVISFKDPGTGKTLATKYDATNGWMSTLTVDLDTTGDYTFNFDNLVLSKYGKSLSYTVEGLSGKTVTLNESGVHTYQLNITDDVDCNGSTVHTYTFVLTATKTSIEPPVKVAEPGGTALLVVKSKNSDWSCAIPALEGTQIKYYNKTSKTYETLSLSSLTPSSTGKQNGTKNFWDYSDPNGNFTLKVTSGYIHEGKQVYGMPVVVNNGGNKMYFTISSTTGYVSTGTASRTVTLSYEFTDANGQTLTFSKTWQFNYADYKNGKQYSYDSFVSGTLKEASSDVCVTGDTLVTLADGTQKQIKDVTNSDLLMVWDFYKGEYAVVPAAIIFNHGYGNNTVIQLNFSDGTSVKAINLHQFMDANENRFVSIDAQNVADYVGHSFVKRDGNGYTTVELVDYSVSQEYIEAYGIISAVHYNILVNDLFSTDFMPEDYDLFNYFTIGDDMKFDQVAMAEDIANYGLYTYADFADVLTYEQFVAFNVQYFKIAVGKGVYTYEGILNLIATYLAK